MRSTAMGRIAFIIMLKVAVLFSVAIWQGVARYREIWGMCSPQSMSNICQLKDWLAQFGIGA